MVLQVTGGLAVSITRNTGLEPRLSTLLQKLRPLERDLKLQWKKANSKQTNKRNNPIPAPPKIMTQSLLPKIQALTPYINHTHASCWLHPLAHSTAVVSQYTIGKEIIFPSRDRYELGVSDVQDPHTFLSFALGYCRWAMVGRLEGHLWCLWKKR